MAAKLDSPFGCLLGTAVALSYLFLAFRGPERELRKELVEKHRQLRSLVDHAPFGIVMISRERDVLVTNSKVRELLGVGSDDEITYEMLRTRLPLEDNPVAPRILSGELPGLAKDIQVVRGEKTTFLGVKLVPVRDESGEVDFVLGVAQDLTEQREAEIKLLHGAKMSSLGEMSAGIAHEINNPLTVISIRSRQIQEQIERGDWSKQSIAPHFDAIEETVERISKIIRGLQAFARDGERTRFETVKLRTIVEDTLSLCRSRFKNHGIRLDYDPARFADLPLECNPVQISQVLLNLLNNAHDAVQNLPAPWVRIETRSDGSFAEIRITDSGGGVPAAIRERVMQPFFTTKQPGKGTGLGLSISLGIVKFHEGTLSLDEARENTCFVIRLPLKHARKPLPRPAESLSI